MALFYGWSSIASGLEPLWVGTLVFTTKSLEIARKWVILPTSEEWKAESNLEMSSGFEHRPMD